MKIIDAFWEKRNLDCKVAEILFEDSDFSAGRMPELPFAGYDLIFGKIPVANIALMHALENIGFRYLETQFEIVRDLRTPPSFPDAYTHILNQIGVSPVTGSAGLNALLDRIDASVFDTDRISLDPLFSPEKGAVRYRNWIGDEYESGKAFLAEMYFNDQPIGFFLLSKKSDTAYFATLAGLYRDYQKKGLGISVVAKPIQWCAANGVKSLVTRNSANNPDSFKVHLNCGYVLRDIKYIFRWARTEATAINLEQAP